MPNLFSSNGRVAVIQLDDNSLPMGLVVGSTNTDSFKANLSTKGVITSCGVDGQSSFQVMHTLRKAIYMYTFGERVGEIMISGLLFNADCNDTFETLMTGGSGINKFFNWYEANRISTTGLPILITIVPGIVLSGFLVKMKFQTEDPSINLTSFAMTFLYAPRIVNKNPVIVAPPIAIAGKPLPPIE